MSDEDSAETADAGPRRGWRIPALIVAGIAVLLVAAALGGVAGRATAPGPTIVVAPGPVVEESPVASKLPVGADDGAVSSAEPDVSASTARPDLVAGTQPLQPWPAIFTAADDLPDVPGTASGYRLTRAGLDGAALAGSLGRELGLTGDVSTTDDGWVVGSVDGTGPSLTVSDDPLLRWSFADPVAAADPLVAAAIPKDRAKELASDLLSRLGVDVSSVDWQIERFADETAVVAWQVVSGARTQLNWRVNFGKNAVVVGASGFAAGIEEVPGYPVVGAATAVRRAGLPTWSVLGPSPLRPESETDVAASSASSTPSPVVGTGERPGLRVDMSEIVVTGAELGLAQFWQPDGDLLILPAYHLTGEDGTEWSLIAVTGDDVHFVNQPYPTENPPAG